MSVGAPPFGRMPRYSAHDFPNTWKLPSWSPAGPVLLSVPESKITKTKVEELTVCVFSYQFYGSASPTQVFNSF